jgi:hypothetical protein
MEVSRSRDEHRETGKRTPSTEEKVCLTHSGKRGSDVNDDLHPHSSNQLLFKRLESTDIEETIKGCNEIEAACEGQKVMFSLVNFFGGLSYLLQGDL